MDFPCLAAEGSRSVFWEQGGEYVKVISRVTSVLFQRGYWLMAPLDGHLFSGFQSLDKYRRVTFTCPKLPRSLHILWLPNIGLLEIGFCCSFSNQATSFTVHTPCTFWTYSLCPFLVILLCSVLKQVLTGRVSSFWV